MSKQYQLLVGNDWERLVPFGEWNNNLEENHSLSFDQIKDALPEDTLIHNIIRVSDGDFCELCLTYTLEIVYYKDLDSYYCPRCEESALDNEDD